MNILIAAGGTGGHLFPGIAIAEEFTARDKNNSVLFIGTKGGMEEHIFSRSGFAFETIQVSGLKGKRLPSLLKSLISIPKSIAQSIMIIKKFNPVLVIGLGGYVSGPVVLAASLMGIKTAIHEQNTSPGLTNRILAQIANVIFVSFEQTLSCFPKGKTLVVGNPVRKQCREGTCASPPGNSFTLGVVGGSLGSHQINSAMIQRMHILM